MKQNSTLQRHDVCTQTSVHMQMHTHMHMHMHVHVHVHVHMTMHMHSSAQLCTALHSSAVRACACTHVVACARIQLHAHDKHLHIQNYIFTESDGTRSCAREHPNARARTGRREGRRPPSPTPTSGKRIRTLRATRAATTTRARPRGGPGLQGQRLGGRLLLGLARVDVALQAPELPVAPGQGGRRGGHGQDLVQRDAY